MIRHIVLLQMREDQSANEIEVIFAALAGLQAVIPEIKAFSFGPCNSPEGINRGYNYGFVMEFANVADRARYLIDPEHIRVASEIVMPALSHGVDSALAFDYEITE